MITTDAVLSKFSPRGIDVLSVPRRVLDWKIKLRYSVEKDAQVGQMNQV